MQSTLEFLTVAEGAYEVLRREPEVHEVAEATAVAFAVFILSAARFAEVGHRRQFSV